MNIAFLFFGQLRWMDLANSTFVKNFMPALNGHNVHYFGYFCNDEYLEDFKKLYSPATVEIEPQKSLHEVKNILNNKSNKISENLPKQLQSLYGVLGLMQKYQIDNNMKFDLYIKIRTDLAFWDPININNFDNNSIYVGKTERNLSEYVQDFVLFTKKEENIINICEMGLNLDNIINNLEKKEMRNLYYHEEVLAEYLRIKHINCFTHNFNINLARHHI